MFKYLLIILIIIQMSCSRKVNNLFSNGYVINSTAPKVEECFYKKVDYSLNFSKKKESEIILNYLGCGGYYISNGHEAILIDPFFSNHRMISLLTGLKTKPKFVNHGISKIKNYDSSIVKAVFVAHSHYDHLMDVPYVFQNYTNDSTKIYSSNSGNIRLTNVIPKKNLINLESEAISSWYIKGKRFPNIPTTNSIRVTPILTAHAPQRKEKRMYSGECKPKLNYDKALKRTRMRHWQQGTVVAYLIDFHGPNKEIEFRVTIQSSAAPPKYGFVIDTIMKEHPVNIAIIGAASFANTTDYPGGLIKHLQPEHVIICHWENFFKPYTREKKKTVFGTEIKEFIYSLNSVFPYKIDDKERFSMPNPGVNITIKGYEPELD